MSHVRYNEANVGEDVIKIYTVEDFFKYFNAGAAINGYDQEKVNNYDEIVKQRVGASFCVNGKLILIQMPFIKWNV